MPVFNFNDFTEIVGDLRAKLARALQHSTCTLTADEFTSVFIVPEHVPKLVEVWELTGASKYQSSFSLALPCDTTDAGSLLDSKVEWAKPFNMLIPQYVKLGIQHGSPASDRLMAWASERRRIGMLAGDAIDAMTTINDMCETPRGFALCFPAIVTVMSNFGDGNEGHKHVKRSRKMVSGSNFGRMPNLDKETIERVREASGVIQALYMALDAEEQRDGGATVRIAAAFDEDQKHHYKRPHIIHGPTSGWDTTTFV